MNGLSWLIYLSDVTHSLSSFFTFLCVILFVITAIMVILTIGSAVNWDQQKPSAETIAENSQLSKRFKRYAIMAICFFIGFGTFAALLPERKTVLLIAASEVGQRMITSDRVQSVVDPSINLLKNWVESNTMDLQAEIQKKVEASKAEVEAKVKEAVKANIKDRVEKEINKK